MKRRSNTFKLFVAAGCLIVLSILVVALWRSSKGNAATQAAQVFEMNKKSRNINTLNKPKKSERKSEEVVGSVEDVLSRKTSLSKDEFRIQFAEACNQLQHASRGEIEQAILSLPPGNDSEGPFHDLAFYLFANSPDTALSFLADRLQDNSFPAEWVYSVVDSGIALLSKTDPVSAIQQSIGAKSVFPTPLGRARLIATAASHSSSENSAIVIDAITSIRDKQLMGAVIRQEALWNSMARSGSVQDLVSRLHAQQIELDSQSKQLLGAAVSNEKGFAEGLHIVQNVTKDDPAAVSAFFDGWFKRDTNQALQGIGELSQSLRDAEIAENISQIADWDRPSAFKWAQSIQNPVLRNEAINKIK